MKPYPIDLVSVVIPVYNEEASLPELLRRTEAACLELGRAFEIVLVDDGSRDRSAELLQDRQGRAHDAGAYQQHVDCFVIVLRH